MIRYKKIRGHNRIQKNIEGWKNNNLTLDLNNLQSRHRDYCKIWVSPFSDISVLNSEFPSPSGKTRKQIIKSLIEIYNSWDAQLKTLNKPYYLAIWLFEPNLENSQIVCAIDSMVNFYDITFFRPEIQKKFPIKKYGKLATDLKKFNWIYALEEHYFTQDDIDMTEDEYASKADYNHFQRYYRKRTKEGGARQFKNETGEITYFNEIGTVWIGTKN